MSETGLECQRWDSQSPHSHSHSADDFPEKDLSLASNYCRNPNGRSRPWCYTTDPDIEWDYCKLGRCHTGTDITMLYHVSYHSSTDITMLYHVSYHSGTDITMLYRVSCYSGTDITMLYHVSSHSGTDITMLYHVSCHSGTDITMLYHVPHHSGTDAIILLSCVMPNRYY